MKCKVLFLFAAIAWIAGPAIAAEEGTAAVENTEGTMGEAAEAVMDDAGETMDAVMDAAMVDNKICPISGNKIGAMGAPEVVEHNGKKYNLCCPACAKDFMKDPEAAIKKIEAEMAAASPMAE